ncbi:MAG: hypothetical protein WC621_05475 [Patescibacteria group bacterium]
MKIIHETSKIDPVAHIGDEVTIGKFCEITGLTEIKGKTIVGDGTKISSSHIFEASIGSNCSIVGSNIGLWSKILNNCQITRSTIEQGNNIGENSEIWDSLIYRSCEIGSNTKIGGFMFGANTPCAGFNFEAGASILGYKVIIREGCKIYATKLGDNSHIGCGITLDYSIVPQNFRLLKNPGAIISQAIRLGGLPSMTNLVCGDRVYYIQLMKTSIPNIMVWGDIELDINKEWEGKRMPVYDFFKAFPYRYKGGTNFNNLLIVQIIAPDLATVGAQHHEAVVKKIKKFTPVFQATGYMEYKTIKEEEVNK